jgi:acetolactate synthase-1/3 small subunit
MEQTYNISLFTENSIGILNRITIIFTRRHLNIESITASECEISGVYRYTIVVNTSLEQVIKVANQIEKQVDVLKAFYHTDAEVVYQELALYKLPTNLNTGGEIEQILRQHQARILSLSPEFTTIEKTGRPEEINALFTDLKPFGVLEFAKSGRVAISKPMKTLEDYLNELQ